MYPWEPSGLSTFFHYFPHYDFSLRQVSSLYNIHIYPYRQGIFLAGSIHLLWFIIAMLIMLAALLQRWCSRTEICPKEVCECDMCWPRMHLLICVLLIIVCLVFEALIHAIILSNMKIDKKRTITYKPLFPTITYNIFPYIRDFFDSERYMMDQISHYAKHPYERFQKDCSGYLIPPEFNDYWSKAESWQSWKLNNTNLTYSEPNITDKEHPLQYLYKEVRPWRRFFYFLFVWCFLLFLIVVSLCMIKKDELFWVPLFLTLVMTCVAAVSLTVVAVALGDACQDPLYTSTFLESVVNVKAQETYCQDWTKEVCITLLDHINKYNAMLYKHLETVKRSIRDHKKIGMVSYHSVCTSEDVFGHCVGQWEKVFYDSDWIHEEIQHHAWVKTLRENQADKKYEDMFNLRRRCQEFEFACPTTVLRISYDTEGAVKSFCEYDCILLPVCIQLISVLIMAALLIRSLLIYIATRPSLLPRIRTTTPKQVKKKMSMKCWIKKKRYNFVKSIHEQTPITLLGKSFRRCYRRMKKCHRRKVIIVKKCLARCCRRTPSQCDLKDISLAKRCPGCSTYEDRLKCKFCSPSITSRPKVILRPSDGTYPLPCPLSPRHPCPEQYQNPKGKSKTPKVKSSERRSKHTTHKTLDTPKNTRCRRPRPDPKVARSQKNIIKTRSHGKPKHHPSDNPNQSQPQQSHQNSDQCVERSSNVIMKSMSKPPRETPTQRNVSKPKLFSKYNLQSPDKPSDEDTGKSSENSSPQVHSSDDTGHCSSEVIESLSSVSITPHVAVDTSFYYNNPADAPCDPNIEKNKFHRNKQVNDPYQQDQQYEGQRYKRPTVLDAYRPMERRSYSCASGEAIPYLVHTSERKRLKPHGHNYFEEPLYSQGPRKTANVRGKPFDNKPRASYINTAAIRPSVLSISSCSINPFKVNMLRGKKSILRRLKILGKSSRKRETKPAETPESYDSANVHETKAVMQKKSTSLKHSISHRNRTSEDRFKCKFGSLRITSAPKVIPEPLTEIYLPPYSHQSRHPYPEQYQDQKEKSKTPKEKTSARRSKYIKHETSETPGNTSYRRPDPEITHFQKYVMKTKSYCKPLRQLLPSDNPYPPKPTKSKHYTKQQSHQKPNQYVERSPNIIVKSKSTCETTTPKKASLPKSCLKSNLPSSDKPSDEDVGTTSENSRRLPVYSRYLQSTDDTGHCSSEDIESSSSMSFTPHEAMDASFHYNITADATRNMDKNIFYRNKQVYDPYQQDQQYECQIFEKPTDSDTCKPVESRSYSCATGEATRNSVHTFERQKMESYDHTYFDKPLYGQRPREHTYTGRKHTFNKQHATYIKTAATRPSVLSIPTCSRSPFKENKLRETKSILRQLKSSGKMSLKREAIPAKTPEFFDCASVQQTTATMRKKSMSLTYRTSHRKRNQASTKKQNKGRTVSPKQPANVLKPRDEE